MKPAALLILLFLSCPTCLMADNAALAARAREQVGVTVSYNGGYQSIPYPTGDVPRETGVCTDVVIRAMRARGGWRIRAVTRRPASPAARALAARQPCPADYRSGHQPEAQCRICGQGFL